MGAELEQMKALILSLSLEKDDAVRRLRVETLFLKELAGMNLTDIYDAPAHTQTRTHTHGRTHTHTHTQTHTHAYTYTYTSTDIEF